MQRLLHDIYTSFFGILILIHTVYPQATGESIISAFHDGTWVEKAINLSFAYLLIRKQQGKEVTLNAQNPSHYPD